jgi:integrase
MSKFNPKIRQERDRIYNKIPNTTGIQRVFNWCGTEYVGGTYEARRYEGKTRLRRSFNSLKEAKDWQAGKVQTEAVVNIGKVFGEVVAEWKRRTFPTLRLSTQHKYEVLLSLHIKPLEHFGILELTPHRIDLWIDDLKERSQHSVRHKNRKSFSHELTCLGGILRYYESYHDDDLHFKYPIKKRHREAVELASSGKKPSKDISPEEFKKFLEQFTNIKNGEVYKALAVVQFFQALRISEAAGLYWEDVLFSSDISTVSRLKIVRSAFWPRRAGMESKVVMGFKNSEANNGVKEQPLFEEAHDVLIDLRAKMQNAKGLVFQIDGKLLGYRSVQHAYDRAFKLAGLTYTATHIMRHGGTRKAYNKTGDLAIAAQLLGNTDIKTVLVYAQRDKAALTKFVQSEWTKAKTEPTLDVNGRSEDPKK